MRQDPFQNIQFFPVSSNSFSKNQFSQKTEISNFFNYPEKIKFVTAPKPGRRLLICVAAFIIVTKFLLKVSGWFSWKSVLREVNKKLAKKKPNNQYQMIAVKKLVYKFEEFNFQHD